MFGDDLAAVGVDDEGVGAGDEEQHRVVLVGASDGEVAEFACEAQRDDARGVDDVVADSPVAVEDF
ncbi:hypothetical protein [Demequina sp. NBRC 110054]|uniref:hypothetical protein n=1 Tax=Demequina sp. NBRC 110054 TaxID=1570343 RepID=UPI0009FF1740|nr:hypothetical protein [Demequina sp. NBRC 110054]